MDDATALIIRQLQTDMRDVRESAGDTKLALSKLWTEHRELTATVQGAQGDNGLRSDVRALEEWRAKVEQHLTDLAAKFQHYIDVEREETCHGKIALRMFKKEIEDTQEEETEVKVAQIQNAGATKVQIMTLIGVVLSPILMAIVTKLLEGVGR